MENNFVRDRSLARAVALGFPINTSLPLLSEEIHEKSEEEILNRLLCLHVVAACSYGFNREKAWRWVEQENLQNALVGGELLYLREGIGEQEKYRLQIEGMWALSWSLGVVPELDFGKGCASSFALLLPNLKISESSDSLKSKIAPRSIEQIFEQCDLAYCLHWGIRQAQISNNSIPAKVPPYVIVERRRALEWLIGDEDWGNVILDT